MGAVFRPCDAAEVFQCGWRSTMMGLQGISNPGLQTGTLAAQGLGFRV